MFIFKTANELIEPEKRVVRRNILIKCGNNIFNNQIDRKNPLVMILFIQL